MDGEKRNENTQKVAEFEFIQMNYPDIYLELSTDDTSLCA